MAFLIQGGEPIDSSCRANLTDMNLATQLLTLHQLLQVVAQSMCTDEAVGVEEASVRIAMLAGQTNRLLADLQMPDTAAAVCAGNEGRRALLSVIEARAFFVAALRRWRRAMHLRRASLQSTQEPAGYGEELTRWA